MLYTVGHSNHDQRRFSQLLEAVPGLIVIDTRSHPTSTMEHWRKESMEIWLAGRYEWWPGLGGWTARHLKLPKDTLRLLEKHGVDLAAYAHGVFPKQRIAASRQPGGDEPEWTNTGLYDYSFYTILPEFSEAANRLLERCYREDLAIMCCEAQWWRCHRSLIADYAVWAGLEATHLMPRMRQKNKVKFIDGARQTKHTGVIGNRLERYDPEILAAWGKWRLKLGSGVVDDLANTLL